MAPLNRKLGYRKGIGTIHSPSREVDYITREGIRRKLVEKYGSLENAKKVFQANPDSVYKVGRNGRTDKGNDYEKYYGVSYHDYGQGFHNKYIVPMVGTTPGLKEVMKIVYPKKYNKITVGVHDAGNGQGSWIANVNKDGIRVLDQYDLSGSLINIPMQTGKNWKKLKKGIGLTNAKNLITRNRL